MSTSDFRDTVPGRPGGVNPAQDAPLTVVEILALLLLFGFGGVWSGFTRVYDAPSWQAAVGLTVLSALSSIGLFRIGLGYLGCAPGRRAASALWASAPWNTLVLSQLA